MERRSLLDDDAASTREPANVFSDDFEVDDDDLYAVADGFRPGNAVREGSVGPSRQDHDHDLSAPTPSTDHATDAITPAMSSAPPRNSIRKSRATANPFLSAEDDDRAPHEQHHTLEFEPDGLARRSISSASSHVYAQTNSPRFAPGPSHPYGMYQQGVARTPSVTTTSTVRPGLRQSLTQSRPQHPYAAYPQGVGDDLDDEDDGLEPVQQNPVPVGFPGLGQGYRRRLGPDGEDQDIIGEDGHTEQLPPYTRYPEEGPEKMPLLVPTMPTALHSRAPVAGTDPGMDLMHNTLRPASTNPQSMTDQSDLDRRASRASMALIAPTSSNDDTSIATGKKSWSEKSWKERRQTRFCGIPFWWILLAVGVLTFIGAVLGGVIGGFVAGGQSARHSAAVKVVTSLYDASPIASPTGAPPTGTFALTLGPPQETQCGCLPIASQQPAWDCNLAPNSAIGLVVDPPVNGQGAGANVFYASYDPTIAYGLQLSSMNTSFAQFITVQDNDDPANGPAFYFQQFYDKVVVVPEDAISTGSLNKEKRQQGYFKPGFEIPAAWKLQKQAVSPSEQPWFCVWNGTFLEGFIYVQENIVTSTSSSSTSATATANSSSSAATTPPPSSRPPATSASWSTSFPATDSGATVTRTLSAPWTTATYTGPAASYGPWIGGLAQAASKEHAYDPDHDDDDDDDGTAYSPARKAKRQADYWATLPVFPYVVKLEERRLPNNPIQPYCQKYQILNNGQANYVQDDDGNPIIVYLQEQDPTFSAYESAGIASSKQRRGTIPGSCHCQWMSGEGPPNDK